MGLFGIGLLVASFWVPRLWAYLFFLGLPALLVAFYSAMVRVDIVLSKKNATLAVQPMLVSIPLKPNAPLFRFSEIREFLIESEFELGMASDETGKGSKPFVWHLTAVTTNGTQHRLTWHFARRPILLAGKEASRITGKPLREQPNPFKSSTWSHWGYNFLR
ncbi:MAG TPA: hypothetical protein VLY23_13060 [Candidatus Acidoferrum sp.]|nr:hypothetical protein [Candidatus Acidoferrum sp.]